MIFDMNIIYNYLYLLLFIIFFTIYTSYNRRLENIIYKLEIENKKIKKILNELKKSEERNFILKSIRNKFPDIYRK